MLNQEKQKSASLLYGSRIGAKAAAVSNNNDVLQQLLKAKQLSDNKKYKTKQLILRQLLSKHRNAFDIDSTLNSKMVGLTHRPTNFRIHAPSSIIPDEVL